MTQESKEKCECHQNNDFSTCCNKCLERRCYFPPKEKPSEESTYEKVEKVTKEMASKVFDYPEEDWRESKKCTQCKQIKPKIGFYKKNTSSDGLQSFCKMCYREYDIARYYRNPKRHDKYPQNRDVRLNYENMKAKYPEKFKARQALRNAVAIGKIIKKPCKICKDPKVEGHHPDYSKPLKVLWLCIKHHKDIHRKKRYKYPTRHYKKKNPLQANNK